LRRVRTLAGHADNDHREHRRVNRHDRNVGLVDHRLGTIR
jgi:hypothetical protein